MYTSLIGLFRKQNFVVLVFFSTNKWAVSNWQEKYGHMPSEQRGKENNEQVVMYNELLADYS
jgi:hypothetical protein